MNIIDFNRNHIEAAMKIALTNYNEERTEVPDLPEVASVPDLTHFADNGLGVAAFHNDRMLGFLGAYYPIDDTFGTTNVKGTFSPIHAHGVIDTDEMIVAGLPSKYNRERIYSLMYQAAAVKWVKAGIRSHAIALYTHDIEAVSSFFGNGFGLRCADAIRSLEDIPVTEDTENAVDAELEYCELPREKWGELLDFHNKLIKHLGKSPTFMHFEKIDTEELYRRTSGDVRYFAAKVDGKYAAYIKIADAGENFATEDKSMINICGAYCSPSYRGTGIYQNLLSHLMTLLKKEGYQLLGVDFESINPNARGFWSKYFTEYTHSVVRRIDEKAFS